MTPAARLSLEEVDHVAHLARLDLEPQERQRLCLDLGAVLDYVGRLAEVETGADPPAVADRARLNVFREDVVTDPLGPAAVLANAPARRGDYFRIPRILEED